MMINKIIISKKSKQIVIKNIAYFDGCCISILNIVNIIKTAIDEIVCKYN